MLLAAVMLLLALRAAVAQDRPLLEPFRIGYARTETIAERMRATASLDQALRRKGFLVTWQDFDSGLAALRALDGEEVDLALDAALPDVIAARRENLKMVFIAELRTIAPSCCELEQLFADHTFKRYTLSSEYFADRREDVLLIVHQEMIRILQQPAQRKPRGPVGPVTHLNPETEMIVTPVTRSTMQEVRATAPAGLDQASAIVDVTDVTIGCRSSAQQYGVTCRLDHTQFGMYNTHYGSISAVSLSNALFAKVQQRVLALIFGHPERSFYTSEIVRHVNSGVGAVERELAKLQNSGLVHVERIGNQKHYRANTMSPIFEELRGLVEKTVGLAEPIKRSFEPYASSIKSAFVYGSVAKQTDTAIATPISW